MATADHTTSSTRTRTLLIIMATMLFVGVWVAIYSFSKNSKGQKTVSPTSGIPTNIYVTPGSKSSEKYAELQQAANVIGTKKAEAQGKTFIPTIVGNKAEDLSAGFHNQLNDILKEKDSNSCGEYRLSKQLAALLAEMGNKQGKGTEDLLRLLRELQRQGYNVADLEALLKKLQGNGYNTDELEKRLAMLKNQGYPINDLEQTLKRLLKEGNNPDLINKILEQLLKDRLAGLEGAIKKLQDAGYNTPNLDYMQKQVNNPDFSKLLEQLANQGYKTDSLDNLLKQLMDKGYNVFDTQIMLPQLQKDGYDVAKLQDLLNQLKATGANVNDIKGLIDALAKKNLSQAQSMNDLLASLQKQGADLDKFKKLLADLQNAGYSKADLEKMLADLIKKGLNPDDAYNELLKKLADKDKNLQDLLSSLQQQGAELDKFKQLLADLQNAGYSKADLEKMLADLVKKGLNPDDIYNELLKKLEEHRTVPTSTQQQLSDIFNAHKSNTPEIPDVDKKYAAIIKKQQEKALAEEKARLAEEKARKLAEEQERLAQQALLRSEAARKDTEQLLAEMRGESDALSASNNKIPPQVFVQAAETKEASNSTSTPSNLGKQAISSSITNKDTILKAGTILFAVLESAVNSDEPGPVLARIVQAPLKNTTLIGAMQTSSNKHAEGILLSFSTVNIPDRIRSYSISAMAIDPNTARTAIASDIDHHYLLRWGTIFAATFLQGYSKAVAQSGTTVQSSTSGAQTNSTTTQAPLNPKQQIYQGIGDMATAWGQGVSTFSNRPTTITINPGVSIGILLTSDFTIPSSDEIPTDQEPTSNEPAKTKAIKQNTDALTTQPTKEQQNTLPATAQTDTNNTTPPKSG